MECVKSCSELNADQMDSIRYIRMAGSTMKVTVLWPRVAIPDLSRYATFGCQQLAERLRLGCVADSLCHCVRLCARAARLPRQGTTPLSLVREASGQALPDLHSLILATQA